MLNEMTDSPVANEQTIDRVSVGEPLIEATGLTRTYRIGRRNIEVLKGINLQIRRGEKVFLCGPSGAGKTTLLYTLAGLERPTSGEVEIDGESLYRGSRKTISAIRNGKMGYIFQNFLLMPELSAIENVLLPAFIGRLDRYERAVEILERVGMGHRLHHLPTELSGGEQQRVAIARALVNDPGIIFADEPTGSLDDETTEQILQLLSRVNEELDMTLLMVTHDAEAGARARRRIRLERGRLMENGKELQTAKLHTA